MTDDVQVIDQCLAGHLESFRLIVEKYQMEAFSHALAILGSREDAEDAIQEAFLDAFRSLDRFDTSKEFYPWFYVLLRNRCFKALRRRKCRNDGVQSFAEYVQITNGEHAQETALHVNDALWSLRVEERELILLRHLDGLTYNELADRLDIPIGTVMSRLYNARCKLRGLLELVEPCDTETSR